MEEIVYRTNGELSINTSVCPRKLRQILRKHNLSKYYNDIDEIAYKLSGKKKPIFTEEMEDNLKDGFRKVNEKFKKHAPKNRTSFFNYNYLVNKLCVKYGYTDFLPLFPTLKSKEKMEESDKIWGKICIDIDNNYVEDDYVLVNFENTELNENGSYLGWFLKIFSNN